jgi:hypothetical protein
MSDREKASPPTAAAMMATPRPAGSVGIERYLANEARPPATPKGAARRLTGGVPTTNKRALSEKKQDAKVKKGFFRLPIACDGPGDAPIFTVSTSLTMTCAELGVNE